MDQLPQSTGYLTLYFQGEPFLNRDIFDCIAYARAKNMYVCSSTNGHFLSEENILKTIGSGLNKLIIPLDGTDQQTYEQYRIEGSFQQVIDGIQDFVRIRRQMKTKKPKLEIQFLVLKSNEHQIKEIKLLGKKLGADKVKLKTAQFYHYEHGNPLIPENQRYNRYRQQPREMKTKFSNFQLFESSNLQIPSAHQHITNKNPLSNRCFRMWGSCVITWDGKVVPCCYDKNADHCMGDLTKNSFRDIWNGKKYQDFRNQIVINRKSIDICRNCNQRW